MGQKSPDIFRTTARQFSESEMQKWPADKVERRAISGLIPYARNARTHSDAQVAQIAASMREWGWTNPVLVDEAGGIIAGHGRVLAARQLGLSEVPVMVAEGWSEAQKRAYILTDNQLPLNAGWDMDVLGNEVKGWLSGASTPRCLALATSTHCWRLRV